MMQLRGLLLENSATLKMLKLHLSISSSSLSGITHMYTCAQQRESYSRGHPEKPADLGELILVVRVDAEARHGGAGEAGAVGQFPHPTDVAHGFIFQGGGRDLHLVLLVCTLGQMHSFLGQSSQMSGGETFSTLVGLTQESAGDVFRHLVAGATHL